MPAAVAAVVVVNEHVLLLVSVPVKVRLPDSVALPLNVPDNVEPLMVVALTALTVIDGVPDSPPAVPVVFWFSVGNVQFVSVPDAGVPSAGATNACPDGKVTVPVNVGDANGASKASAASARDVSVATARST